MTTTDVQRSIQAVWRIEASRLIATLARWVRDVNLAEDLAQDALVQALERWPHTGIPERPGAWLMTTAQRKAIDVLRRRKMLDQKHAQLARDLEAERADLEDQVDRAIDDEIGDDLLRLVFACCHPVLAPEARVALTLRMLDGLTTDEIARAFLVTESTMAQRIVRAKKTLARAGVPFEVPRGAERDARLASVLEVVYLVFNEGYTATAGGEWMRPALCQDALRLGRILAQIAPDEPEVHGLIALMEIQASRIPARLDEGGAPVLLLEQNRARWDPLLIRRGLMALERAERSGRAPGPYQLQAAIAACHARARTAGDTDWPRIVELYDALGRVSPSPIVELNRAVAVGMASGPAAGLRLIDELRDDPTLASYHLLPSVRGDLLAKLGRRDEARLEFERAAALTRNERERVLLLERAGSEASG